MQESLLEDYLKLTKPDDPLKISKEMVVTAQLKKECESRAMKIVEFSIEGKLRPEVFIRCLPFIDQSHYQDIVEERAITKLCGYSVCGKRIPDMPKKQYFISTKSNKVYDITERKNFCSNFCYKASIHIRKQINNSPLWLRRLDAIPEYKLLQSSDGGVPGEVVDQGIVKTVEEEMRFTSINTFAQASLGDLSDKDTADPGKNANKKGGFKKPVSRLKSTMQTINETEVEEETAGEAARSTRRTDNKKSMKLVKKEAHKRNCIVSLPSIEENEEKLQSSKENDRGKELNVIVKVEVVDNVEVEDAKLEQIKQERLEQTDSSTQPPEEDQPHPQSEHTTSAAVPKTKTTETNSRASDQTKIYEEISIKSEPPERKTEKPPTSSETKHHKKSLKKRNSNPKILDVENIVKNAMDGWITLETCMFIHGEPKVRRVLSEKKLSDCFDDLHVQDLQMEQQMKYMEICRRLQLQEMADDKFDNALVGLNKLKPLPDFQKLKQDTKDLKVKVKSFYDGSMYEQADKNFPTQINKKPEQEGDPEEGPPAVLPMVDVNSQNLLRRKIFLSSLSKAIQQLLQSLGVPYSSVLSDVQALVKTFRLRADNITFKPLVWCYIALVLLDLLSLKDESLRDLLDDRRSQEYIKLLFEGLPSKRNFVSDTLSGVKDIGLFVERYITRKDSNNK